jgi:hypothetical protein
LINQLLLATLGEKFSCIRLVAIDGVEEHIRPGDSFVDDTMTGTTNDDPDLEPISTDRVELTTSEETLIAKMEEIIKFFLDLLQVTGGDIAPEKYAKLLQPKLRQPTDTHTSQRKLRATQVRCALARAYTEILQNRPLRHPL